MQATIDAMFVNEDTPQKSTDELMMLIYWEENYIILVLESRVGFNLTDIVYSLNNNRETNKNLREGKYSTFLPDLIRK